MADLIFQRRDIARALDVIATNVSHKDAHALARRIDRNDRVPAMWEAIIVAQASKEKNFRHETPLKNGRKPDLLFELQASDQIFDVYSDIGAVSDAGREAENPVLLFLKLLGKRKAKAGLTDIVLDVRVEHERMAFAKGGRAKLSLSSEDRMASIIKRKIIPRLRTWKEQKKFPKEAFQEDGFSVTITRKPDGSHESAGWAGFTSTSMPEDTALFKALRAKRDQLVESPDESCRVIIMADGGHHLLSNDLSNGPFSVTTDDVCRHFLLKHGSIDSILILAIETKPPQILGPPGFRYSIQPKFYAQYEERRRPSFSPQRTAALQACLDRWINGLPKPVRSAVSVLWSEKREKEDSLIGGYIVSGNIVKVPARRAIEMLAGLRTPEEWGDEFGGDKSLPTQAILNHIMSGRRIISSSIEPMKDVDGEWLVIEFGEVDPSFASFETSLSTSEDKS